MIFSDMLPARWEGLRKTWRRRGPVEVDHLILMCGLKRSGLHAVSFWLLGHTAPHALVNNSPQKRPGEGSPMSRTIQTSPLPVEVDREMTVSVCRRGVECTRKIPGRMKTMIVVFQSQHLWHLRDYQPLVRGIRAGKTTTLLLLRDPFNWAASYMEKSRHPNDNQVWPRQWKEYADEYTGKTAFLPGAVKVNYNQWFIEQDYRRDLATRLGFDFTDRALNVVTPHAGGSSFDRTNYSGRAQQMPVLERWKTYRNNPGFRTALQSNPDIVETASELFALPADLRQFVAECQVAQDAGENV